jgi:AcrR family transcriptional regulator
VPKAAVARPRRDDPTASLLPPAVTSNGALRRIQTTAVQLFAERGYHGVSVRDITSSLGVQPSSLYAHFPSKEALFTDLAHMANVEIRDRMRAALLAVGAEPAEQVRALVRAHVTFHATFPLLATIGHNDLHVLSGEALHKVTGVRKDAVDLLRDVIQRGVDSGDFTCPDPWLAVSAIAGMSIRVAVWYRPPGYSLDAHVEGYPAEVRSWMPQESVEDVVETYARYALCLLTCAAGR